MPRNTAQERLKQLAKARRKLPTYFLQGLAGSESSRWPDYSNVQFRAREVLTLDGPDAPYIKKAFEEFGLDPRNPRHWHELLGYFARAHYKKGTLGAPEGQLRASPDAGLAVPENRAGASGLDKSRDLRRDPARISRL
jgi:hypothetical protein